MRIVQGGFNQLRDALFARVGQYAVRMLAFRTFVHLHELSLRFHLERRTGGLSRVIERGVKGIETIVRFTMLATAPTILEFALTAAIFAFAYGWLYVVVIAVTVWLYIWFTVRASNWRISIRREMNESDTDANTKAIDSLLNYETVKYFNNEKMEAERFDRSMARYEAAATKTWTSLGWLNFGQGVIFGLGMTIVMWLSAREVMAGTQTRRRFRLRQRHADAAFAAAQLHRHDLPRDPPGPHRHRADVRPARRAARRSSTGRAPRRWSSAQGKVEFRDVHFAYDPARPILKGVSFEVPAGKTVAIVGPSGAGKSTISRLLFRFYDIQGGAILIDGQDIRDVTQESLRAAIGMVPQDTVLFNDTIAYNIRYGRPDADPEEVTRAADLAQIGPFIAKLPDGYRTMVGERGLKLSGGEKQRVAIARTILKAPPILMLDEATSALDTHTEQRDPGGARHGQPRPHHHRHRAPAVDGDLGRRDHRPEGRRDRRARHAPGAARRGRPLCRDVEPPARGDRGRGTPAHRPRGRRARRRRAAPHAGGVSAERTSLHVALRDRDISARATAFVRIAWRAP